MTKLSVNINKIAVIRNSRGGNCPDVVRAALDIERFGADGITVHPRPDARHIRHDDVRALKRVLATELNIEGNPVPAFVDLVLEDYPAKASGLMPGDLILSINGQRMMDYRDLSMFLQLHPEEELRIRYGRMEGQEGNSQADWYSPGVSYQTMTTTLSTVFNQETESYMMGIEHMPSYHKARNLFHLFQLGWHEVWFQGRAAIESFGLLFRGYLGTEDLGGPVRIVADIGEVVEQVRPAGWLSVLLTLMNLGVVLSASLGAMNLLPIPALDGGRLAFLLVEAVRGKPIDQEKESMVHLAGLVLLMGLMLVIMFNDIRNLVFCR